MSRRVLKAVETKVGKIRIAKLKKKEKKKKKKKKKKKTKKEKNNGSEEGSRGVGDLE